MSDPPKLGYIGVGLMGEPMCRRLLAANYPLTVWGRNEARLASVLAAGAAKAASPADLARASDIVFTCVTDTAAVEAVVFGIDGIARGAAAGKLLIDMSSIDPAATRTMAARLRAETGMGWIDAPVSGGPPGAEAGTLTVMAGGATEDFERVRAVIGHLAGRFTLMGPNGAGQTTKLINQAVVGCELMVLAEATQLALDAGIDAARLPEALAGGRADSPLMQTFVPRMVARDFTPTGRISILLKDLAMVRSFAADSGTPMAMTAAARGLYQLLAARGLADADVTAVIRLFDGDPG